MLYDNTAGNARAKDPLHAYPEGLERNNLRLDKKRRLCYNLSTGR